MTHFDKVNIKRSSICQTYNWIGVKISSYPVRIDCVSKCFMFG